MPRKRRRRIKPADNHTPDLTLPICEAKDCGVLLPLCFVQLPGLERRVWLCHQHFRYWQLDAIRAQTRAWQKEQELLMAARVEEWALNHVSLVARLEVELGRDGIPVESVKPIVIDDKGTAVAIRKLAPVARTLDWGAARRIGQVVLDG